MVAETGQSLGRILVSSSADAVRDFRSRLTGGQLEKIVVQFRGPDMQAASFEISGRASLKFDDDSLEFCLDQLETIILNQAPKK